MSFINYIHNGDTLEHLKSLPNECVDLVVSSPPYNIGKEYESRVALGKYLAQQEEVLKECVRVLKSSGSIFWQIGAFVDNGAFYPLDVKFFNILESLDLNPVNRIIWAKQHGLHARNKFSCRHETILWFSKTKEYRFYLDNIRVPQKYQNKKHFRGDNKGTLSCNPEGKNPGDIWVFRNVKHNHEEQTIHPCQFPEDMITRIILSTTEPNDLVLDPYMGTATTAVVAKDLGRLYTGAELNADYFEVSLRRLSGLPDKDGRFANLKCLRKHVTETGEDVTKYSFDQQTTKTPSMSSKIFGEEYHLEELYERLSYENDCFVNKLNGMPPPENLRYDKLKPRPEDIYERPLFKKLSR